MIIIEPEVSKYKIEKIYPVSMSEVDMSGAVKPACLLNYMQDLAAKSIAHIGYQFSIDGLLEKGLGWFLIRYRIEFDEYPIGVKNVLVQTESRGVNRLTAYRDFECFDADTNNRLLRATSSWYIVDLKSKSLVNIAQEFPEFISFEKREDDLSLNKLRPFDNPDSEKVFHVRYDDLDMNGHVNNTVYITWALESLDFDFRSSHKLKNLDIYFKQEVRYGEDIVSIVKLDRENLVSEHLIKNTQTGDEVCLLKAEYESL